MGAYLYYKLAKDTAEQAHRVNNWLENNKAQKQLEELDETVQPIYFFEEDYYPGIGAGSVKTSSIMPEHYDKARQLYTELFDALHNSKFEVKILTKSCSLRLITFSIDQMLRLTDNGNALSGEGKQDYKNMLRRAKRIRPYPSKFTDTFSRNNEKVLSEIPNIDRWKIKDPNLLHRLNDLLRDRRRLKVLDTLLTFKESLPISLIANETHLDEIVVQEKLKELQQYHLVKERYGNYRINSDHKLADDLKEMHQHLNKQAPQNKTG